AFSRSNRPDRAGQPCAGSSAPSSVMRQGFFTRSLMRAYAYSIQANGLPNRRGNAAMLLNRDEIREDKAFDQLTGAILDRDAPRVTGTFFNMVRDGQTVGDALSIVAAAEPPFVNVPCHINMRDGNIALTNN